MDVVTFIKERNRMCDFYKCCKIKGCPAENLSCDSLEETATQGFALIKYVEKWSSEHPQKTMLQDFLEKFPKALLGEDGVPEKFCPHDVGYTSGYYCHKEPRDCVKCWNRPVEG